MKNSAYRILVCLLCIISFQGYTQLDSLVGQPLYTQHLTLKETFFGNEEMYQVCYPKDHRWIFTSIIIFSIVTVILGALIIYIKSSTNKKLKEKNNIIAEQNKDLIDSINYSLRIQQAILPDKKTEEAVLKNGFVLYKPKNIVSGDFYWLNRNEDIIYLAIIDCTGHGVPGALLTMLAYNAINKAVLEKDISDPTLILDNMNTNVKEALKQDKHNTIQDSMEVGVVCFNTTSNQLQFSGANLALTYIQNGELKIANGGKCSVGSVQDSSIELPKTHTIQLKTGDSFYLYTDGYADQFGGEKGKKFKYKQLEQLLLANHGKSAREQYAILNATIDAWKGKLEQVDDISVIGLKVT
ncbi:MAG: SpoIIE family protein phosphatase [Bacteroidota bacterium]